MKTDTLLFEISFLSYWHAGCGFGRSADVDALMLKGKDGLPYLPGRTIKGLLREALQCCEDAGTVPPRTAETLFGKPAKEGEYAGSIPGILIFDNAYLPEKERKWLRSQDGKTSRPALFDSFASTSLDSDGIAKDKTLRTIELCVPLSLVAKIGGVPEEGDTKEYLQKAAALLRSAGAHRSRGLGRCSCTIRERSDENERQAV